MGNCNRFTFSLFSWSNQQNASTNSVISCLWCPSLVKNQPTSAWMLIFSCPDCANVLFEWGKCSCFSGHNCSPPLTSKELIVNPQWLMGTWERLASVTLSITIHQLFFSSPASLPVTPCLQPVEMWMSVTLERGALRNYTPQDKLYCTPVSSSKS